MSYKTKPLRESEIAIPESDLFFSRLIDYCTETGKDIASVKVLDWGCGRGGYVGSLLSKGIDAYGVDIDKVVLEQSKSLFTDKKWNHEERIVLISTDNKSPFDNEYFDFIFSDQVIEHVSNVTSLFNELNRISKSGALNLHRFPAKYRVVEPHLFMPFVHWIPKGVFRYLLILFYVLIKIEPNWTELNGKNVRQKAGVYAKYSRDKTFYYPISKISRLLKTYFNDIRFESHFYSKYKLFYKLVTKLNLNKYLGLRLNSVTVTFYK